MATRDLTGADFEATITGNDIVLVDFWASWCGPCRQFAPVFDAASQRHPDVVFAKVDTEAERELAAAAQITSIPTLMAFREGILVFGQAGALPAAGLEQVIEGIRALDMTVVKQEVAATQDLLAKPEEVSLDDLAVALTSGDIALIDVREPAEYAAGHVPEATLIPLGDVPAHLAQVPAAGAVYVICASGKRSLDATRYLRHNGIEAYSVAGGTQGWAADGRPLATGGPDSPA